jgi:hypothetical protein
MAGGVRYRYKGSFISAAKAQKISNLKNATKFLTSEYTYKNKGGIQREGYHKPVERLVAEAIKAGRDKAITRRFEQVPVSYKDKAKIVRRKVDKKLHDSKVLSLARDAAKIAEEEDVDIATALDSMMGEREDRFIRDYYEDIAEPAQGALDYGDEVIYFDMEDLEEEAERIS